MKKRVIAVILILSMVLTMGSGLVKEKKAEAMGQILGNSNGFLLADQNNSAKIYVDTLREEVSYGDGHEYCGLKIIADTFAEDVGLVTGNSANVVTSASEMSGNVIIAGTVGHNDVIDTLAAKGVIDISGLYKNGELKWDCYQMQFVDGSILSGLGYQGINRALVITGSNKRGAMYGLFNISEHIGVSAWVYMADALPQQYQAVYLDESFLEFNNNGMYLAKEPSVKYRGFFYK